MNFCRWNNFENWSRVQKDPKNLEIVEISVIGQIRDQISRKFSLECNL